MIAPIYLTLTTLARQKDEARNNVASNRTREQRQGFSTKQASSFLLVGACFFFFLLSSAAASESFGLRVTRFLQDEALTTCNESIMMADADGDGKLSSAEYTTFISIITDGLIDVGNFSDLPLRLRTVYHLTACACIFQPGSSSDCCVGDNSNIPIEEIESESPSVANFVFCSEVARGIEDAEDDMVSPTTIPIGLSSSPTVSPSSFPPLHAPTASPAPATMEPVETPLQAPTVSPAPVETLCIDFQYEIINDLSLSADDIMNEVDNSVKDGLVEATRTTVINILNETYPRSDGARVSTNNIVPRNTNTGKSITGTHDASHVGQFIFPDGRYRKLLQIAEQADSIALEMDFATYHNRFHDAVAAQWNATRARRLQVSREGPIRRSRRLVYYSDEYPVEITMVVDSVACPGGTMDDTIRCAVVSSTVCVVLEPGDDPVEIRQAIVDGLSESFVNGDFVANIPPDTFGSE